MSNYKLNQTRDSPLFAHQVYSEFSALGESILTAGEALLEIFQDRLSGALNLQIKTDGSAVTRADYASNEILISGIQAHHQDDAILSEEIPNDRSFAMEQRLWVIDPLDGTQRFIDGFDDFAVLVGLFQGGKPLFGAMLFPARQELAVAIRGHGAFCNEKRISASAYSNCREQSVYVRNTTITNAELAVPHHLDSGDALFKVASGQLDGAIIYLSKHREWDLAAPIAIIEEAGGRVTDAMGKPFRIGIESVHDRFFVASNGLVHEQLLQELVNS
jgi:myo-inositol-1(or 4)-monophosphatase